MNTTDIAQLMNYAVALANEAGPLACRYFRQRVPIDNKLGGNAFDPVTAADREVERFLRQKIKEQFPDFGIIGEEEGYYCEHRKYCWVIDPIDGTRAFISGLPEWGILLGLNIDGRPQLGVMHQPFTRETFSGALEVGATLARDGIETPLATSSVFALKDATLYCSHPSLFAVESERAAFERVSAQCRLSRFGGACYAYCMVALGTIDLVIEASLNSYDIAPLIPIIESAGGIVTNRTGGAAHDGGFVVAAANHRLHAAAIEALAFV